MDLFKAISKELKGPSKASARGEHSADVQFSRALKNMEMLVLGITVVSTTLASEADAELDTLSGEDYNAAFKRWTETYSKPGKYTVVEKDETTGEEKTVEKVRPILKPLASPELHETRFGQVRALQPGEIVEKVVKLLTRDVSVEAIELHAGEKIRSFPWAKVREALMTVAREKECNLTDFARVFGLEDSETVVVDSEEQPAKKAARSRKTKAA